jgi:hypothetical protein
MKAFPSTEPIYRENVIGIKQSNGMDLRDYFACHAMPTILKMWNDHIKNNPDQDWDENTIEMKDMALIAEDCYAMADAMMEARK